MEKQNKTTSINNIGIALDALNDLNATFKREIICPINKAKVITSLLKVGDDYALRTSLTSPDTFEKELSFLVYTHYTPIDNKVKPEFDDFCKFTSKNDRYVMIWSILNSTPYSKLENVKIRCPNSINKNSKCDAKEFIDNITYDELLNENSLCIWDESQEFYDYSYPIIKKINTNKIKHIEFYTKIPSIKDRIDILSLLGIDKINHNYESIGEILSSVENLVLVTKMIRMILTDDTAIEINSLQELHMFIIDLPITILRFISTEYSKKFDKYNPKFQKLYTCATCKEDFEYDVDIEFNLYQSYFPGEING